MVSISRIAIGLRKIDLYGWLMRLVPELWSGVWRLARGSTCAKETFQSLRKTTHDL